jgi:hypothetical protein
MEDSLVTHEPQS